MTECPWCGASFAPVRRGDRAKRFCSSACKNAWNGAARAVGRDMEERGVLKLRTWFDHRSASQPAVHGTEAPRRNSGAGEGG